MGRKDTITKEYMRNPVVFADAFNNYLYHGRQVIKPEELKESDIHYAVPVKNGLYDFMQLAHQVAETAKSHKREEKKIAGGDSQKLSKGEYLSGFYKTDRLLPVITLTVFYSAEEWDGPLTLREMYSNLDDRVLQHVPDYKVNLIAPGNMPENEIEQFQSSLREVMLYIKYSRDKKKLQEITRKNKKFRNLERQAAEVISVTTNSKLKYPEGQEAVDVCAAIEEMKMDSRTEGKKEGKIEGEIKGSVETYQEAGFSLQDTIQRMAGRFGLSLEKSEKEARKYWK